MRQRFFCVLRDRKWDCADELEKPFLQKNILELPEELLLYIFSFLTPSELCMSVAKVCTVWEDLAYQPVLWRSLEYRCHGDQKIEERNRIFQNAPCLHRLTIVSLGCVDTCDLLSGLKGRVMSVSELVLSGRRLGSDFYKEIAPHFEGVNKLVLRDVRLRQEDYSALGKLRSMTSIELSGDRVSWLGLQTLLSSCPDVSSIRIGVLACEDEEGQSQELALIETLNAMSTKLTHCHLLGPLMFSDRVLEAFCNCLRLQELEINDCTAIEGDGLIKGIMTLPSLQRMILPNLSYVPSPILNDFFKGIHLERLFHLNIAVCTNLEDECLQAISTRCPNLQSLNIRGCENVTDVGVASVLDNCQKLESLELWGLSKLTGDCFRFLLPPSLPELQLIDLRYCIHVPQELLRKLETKGRRVMW